jgi:hypothetical protein
MAVYQVTIEVDETSESGIDAREVMHEERLQEVIDRGYPFVSEGVIRIMHSRRLSEGN